MRLALASMLLAGSLAACVGTIDDGGPAPSPAPVPSSPSDPVETRSSPITPTKLVVHALPWKSDTTPIGKVTGVVEVGTAPTSLVVFSDVGASLLTSGVVVAQDTSVRAWRDAAAIPAADRNGTWAVGVDADGHVRRLRAERALEDVTARYALEGRHIVSVVPFANAADASRVAFTLADGLAITDATSVTRWDGIPLDGVAASSTRVAGIPRDGDSIRILDVTTAKWRTLSLPGVTSIAFDVTGRLVATAVDSLFIEATDGALVRRFQSKDVVARGLVRAGTRLWLAIGRDLATLVGDALAITEGHDLPGDARLIPAASGDVFVVSGGNLFRYSTESIASPLLAAWTSKIQPIFVRACSKCHMPGGSSKVDLSTFDGWVKRKDALQRRVIVEKTMPPAGAMFTEVDRATIASWLTMVK